MTIVAAKSDLALRRVRSATLAQLRAILPDESVPGWTPHTPGRARNHAGRTIFLLTDALQTLGQPTTRRATSLGVHLEHRARAATMIDELTREVIGNDTVEVLAPQAHRLFEDLTGELETEQPPAVVETLFGTAKLVDYLRGVLLDACDLALSEDLHCPDPALVEASRALASVLGERHPGSTIEVRVPPATAVQIAAIGQGSSHTRGTPPNVVETDPATFVALALGRMTWDEARGQHRVQASGTHADDVGALLGRRA